MLQSLKRQGSYLIHTLCVWNHTTLGNMSRLSRTRQSHIVFLTMRTLLWHLCCHYLCILENDFPAVGRSFSGKTNLFIFLQGTSHEAHLFGLEPFTTYHIGVVATNQAGEVSSPWTLVQTLESSPSGLSNLTVEQKENGRALFLRWLEPVRSNGVIKVTSTLNMKSCLVFSRYIDEPWLASRLLCESCLCSLIEFSLMVPPGTKS